MTSLYDFGQMMTKLQNCVITNRNWHFALDTEFTTLPSFAGLEAFGILAFGIWHLAFGIWRLRHLALVLPVSQMVLPVPMPLSASRVFLFLSFLLLRCGTEKPKTENQSSPATTNNTYIIPTATTMVKLSLAMLVPAVAAAAAATGNLDSEFKNEVVDFVEDVVEVVEKQLDLGVNGTLRGTGTTCGGNCPGGCASCPCGYEKELKSISEW